MRIGVLANSALLNRQAPVEPCGGDFLAQADVHQYLPDPDRKPTPCSADQVRTHDHGTTACALRAASPSPTSAVRRGASTSSPRDRAFTDFRPARAQGCAWFAPCGSTRRREVSASERWEHVDNPTALILQGRGVAWNGLPNRRVQRPHSRVTARAYCRTGRATRRAADARRWAD